MKTIDTIITREALRSALGVAAWCLVGPVYLTALFIADALHNVPTV